MKLYLTFLLHLASLTVLKSQTTFTFEGLEFLCTTDAVYFDYGVTQHNYSYDRSHSSDSSMTYVCNTPEPDNTYNEISMFYDKERHRITAFITTDYDYTLGFLMRLDDRGYDLIKEEEVIVGNELVNQFTYSNGMMIIIYYQDHIFRDIPQYTFQFFSN